MMNAQTPKLPDHEHDLEYGQTGSDFMNKMVQVRCRSCGYKSYTFFRSLSEVPVEVAA